MNYYMLEISKWNHLQELQNAYMPTLLVKIRKPAMKSINSSLTVSYAFASLSFKFKREHL